MLRKLNITNAQSKKFAHELLARTEELAERGFLHVMGGGCGPYEAVMRYNDALSYAYKHKLFLIIDQPFTGSQILVTHAHAKKLGGEKVLRELAQFYDNFNAHMNGGTEDYTPADLRKYGVKRMSRVDLIKWGLKLIKKFKAQPFSDWETDAEGAERGELSALVDSHYIVSVLKALNAQGCSKLVRKMRPGK